MWSMVKWIERMDVGLEVNCAWMSVLVSPEAECNDFCRKIVVQIAGGVCSGLKLLFLCTVVWDGA